MRWAPQLAFWMCGLVAGVALARAPLVFEPNQGQFSPEIAFLARAPGFTVKLVPAQGGLVFQADGAPPAVLRLRAARTAARPTGEQQGVEQISYFHGNDPTRWRTHVHTFGRVRWTGVYPGVDLLLRGTERGVEVDFEVAPGASSAPIAWSAGKGAVLRVLGDGALRLDAGKASFLLTAPLSFERGPEGAPVPLTSRYEARPGASVGFAVSGRSAQRSLLIDPEIVLSGYVANTSTHAVTDTCLTATGNLALVGTRGVSGDVVTDGSTLKGSKDVLLVVIRAGDNVALYSSYIGGGNDDSGQSLALAPDGNLIVGGFTSSTDFPTQAPVQAANAGGADGFMMRISEQGELVSSTYWGGSGDELLTGVAADAAGNVYGSGTTTSSDFPFRNVLQVPYGGGNDAFVFKLNAGASSAVYSQALGGNDFDWAFHVAAAPDGTATLAGETKSTNFPTRAAMQSANAGDFDGFVARLDATGALIYSTYWGSSGTDTGYGISLGPDGSAWMVGYTTSSDFPVSQPFLPFSGTEDGYFAHFDSSGVVIRSSLTGAGQANGVSVDPNGGVFVLGSTSSSTFPLVDPSQSTFGGGALDEFLLHLAPNGNSDTLDFSTYLGGNGDDQAVMAHASSSGIVFVVTTSDSTDFNTEASGAVPSPGTYNFVTEFSVAPVPQALSPVGGPGAGGTAVTMSGLDFRAGDQLLFDGVAATSVQMLDSHHLLATTPPHAPGAVDVEVSRGMLHPVLAGAFTYQGDTSPLDAGAGTPAGGGASLPSPGRFRVSWACEAMPAQPLLLTGLGWAGWIARRRLRRG